MRSNWIGAKVKAIAVTGLSNRRANDKGLIFTYKCDCGVTGEIPKHMYQ